MIPEVAGALIGGGLNLAGDIFGETTARNAYKHRYQDEVKDLRAAGLNPALAYGNNPGNPNTVSFSGIGDATIGGAQAAASAKQAAANADLTKSQALLLKAQTVDLVNQVKLRNAQLAADTKLTGETSAKTHAQRRQEEVSALNAERLADPDYRARRAADLAQELGIPKARAEAKLYKALGAAIPAAGPIASGVSSATALFNLIMRGIQLIP